MGKLFVKLPSMGESINEATLTSWLKDVGDKIEIDEIAITKSTEALEVKTNEHNSSNTTASRRTQRKGNSPYRCTCHVGTPLPYGYINTILKVEQVDI